MKKYENTFSNGIKNYFNFTDVSGRATRTEFWAGVITMFIICCILGMIIVAPLNEIDESAGNIAVECIGFVGWLSLIPTYMRRLHDIGRSGFWAVLTFVPLASTILFLCLGIVSGDKNKNQYGKPRA